MKQPLAPNEQKCLNIITSYIEAREYPPTLQEIAEAMGLATRSGAHRYVHVLAQKGHLVIEDGPRALRVIR